MLRAAREAGPGVPCRDWVATRSQRRAGAGYRRSETVRIQPLRVCRVQGGVVDDLYRDLLCDVYQLSALELGLVEPPITPDSAPPMPELVERLTFGRLDAGLIELLRGQTQHLRLA